VNGCGVLSRHKNNNPEVAASPDLLFSQQHFFCVIWHYLICPSDVFQETANLELLFKPQQTQFSSDGPQTVFSCTLQLSLPLQKCVFLANSLWLANKARRRSQPTANV